MENKKALLSLPKVVPEEHGNHHFPHVLEVLLNMSLIRRLFSSRNGISLWVLCQLHILVFSNPLCLILIDRYCYLLLIHGSTLTSLLATRCNEEKPIPCYTNLTWSVVYTIRDQPYGELIEF